MDERLLDFCKSPYIEKYEDIHLLTLSENCAALEERLYEIAQSLPNEKQALIKAYIDIRNDLEFETVKTAMRWSKKHYL